MKRTGKRLRLNQAIAKSGLCSRRQADALIAGGRVKVNGKVTTDFSLTIDPGTDRVAVDGKPLAIKEFVCVAMYKPRGYITTVSDERGRRTVMELLPAELRHLRPVGRLDRDSEGLLIFTNDGDLTQKLAHPAHHLPKRYKVTVHGRIADTALHAMSSGLMLADGPTQPAAVKLIQRTSASSTFEIVIREGRNRQIRRMCEQLGYSVARLLRVGIGRLQLGQMTPGSWRFLRAAELRQLVSGQRHVARADRSKIEMRPGVARSVNQADI